MEKEMIKVNLWILVTIAAILLASCGAAPTKSSSINSVIIAATWTPVVPQAPEVQVQPTQTQVESQPAVQALERVPSVNLSVDQLNPVTPQDVLQEISGRLRWNGWWRGSLPG